MNNRRNRITIPPYWVNYAMGAAFLAVGVWLKYRSIAYDLKDEGILGSGFIIGVSILILIETSFHYSIHEKGITVRFLWIPIRRIPWDDVSHAQYICKWHTGAKFGNMQGQGIFITLKGCPYFCPEIDALNLFPLRHPFKAFFIRFTPKHQKTYVDIFAQHYSKLEYQIGAKDNLK